MGKCGYCLDTGILFTGGSFPQSCFYCKTESKQPYYGSPDSPYEVIKVIEAWGLQKDAYLFNVIKYVARAGKKDATKELEDLKKALYYLKRKIDNYESTQGTK